MFASLIATPPENARVEGVNVIAAVTPWESSQKYAAVCPGDIAQVSYVMLEAGPKIVAHDPVTAVAVADCVCLLIDPVVVMTVAVVVLVFEVRFSSTLRVVLAMGTNSCNCPEAALRT
jgi:hypothetical protein